jgi:hypothetical protein
MRADAAVCLRFGCRRYNGGMSRGEEAAKRPWQFSLRVLMLLTFVVAVYSFGWAAIWKREAEIHQLRNAPEIRRRIESVRKLQQPPDPFGKQPNRGDLDARKTVPGQSDLR